MKLENEKPKRFFAKHMVQGVAGYQDFNLYASNEAISKMETSFEGKPLLVDHQNVDHENLKNQMDGVVVKSFYNKWDGWHWCEIVAITDEAVNAIENKNWKVSNCYTPSIIDTTGTYLNIGYDQVLDGGEYDHLALVENPRYEDSVVLTPSQFKAYNEAKEQQFISNSKVQKPKGKKMFEFFKKVKIENELNPEELIVKLENGKELSIAEAVTKLSNMLDETVIIEGHVFSFGELVEEKKELLINAKKKSEKEDEEEDKKENADEEDDEEDDKKENEDDSEEEKENGAYVGNPNSKKKKKKNADEEEDEEDEDDIDLENSLESLMNEGHFQGTMELIRNKGDAEKIMTDRERVELGKLKY